jgi:hypothetical protein
LTVLFTTTQILYVGKKRSLPLEWSADRGSAIIKLMGSVQKTFYCSHFYYIVKRLELMIVPFTSTLILHSGKKMNLPLEWSLVRSSTLVGSSHAYKYQTRVELNVSAKTLL